MEKTKGILVKMFYNMHKDDFSRLEFDQLFTLEDLKSSLSEVLDEEKVFIMDLAIFIEEINKRCVDFDEIPKEDMKTIRNLWEGFDSVRLSDLRETCSDEQIKNIITKMLILKNAYKRINEELVSIDLEDYFVPRERLIEIVL
jgi:hypothetical protein